MKYLFLAGLFLSLAAAQDYNEDVSRKINLDANGVIEVHTDLRFKGQQDGTYYFVLPEHLEQHLVSLSAVASMTQAPAKVERVKLLPASLRAVVEEKNAHDLAIFKISTEEATKGVLGLSIKEVYKRRKEPFPSTVKITEE